MPKFTQAIYSRPSFYAFIADYGHLYFFFSIMMNFWMHGKPRDFPVYLEEHYNSVELVVTAVRKPFHWPPVCSVVRLGSFGQIPLR